LDADCNILLGNCFIFGVLFAPDSRDAEIIMQAIHYTPAELQGLANVSNADVALARDMWRRYSTEKAIWEGYAAASSNGVTVESYLARIGLSEEEIADMTKDMGVETVPPEGVAL
jgi:hypothetical protein